MGKEKKKSTLNTVKTGVKVAKTVATSKYVQNGVKIVYAATVAVYLRHRIQKEEGIL